MTTETPIPDGGTTTATAAASGSHPTDTPQPGADSAGIGGSFPFQQEQTTIEQPRLDDFLDLTPVDDPDADVIGPQTSTEQQFDEYNFARPGNRIRINSVYTGTIREVLTPEEYRASDHPLLVDLGHTHRRQRIYHIDTDTDDPSDLFVFVTFGYSSTIRVAEYVHDDLTDPVDITQVSVTNHALPAGVDTDLYHTLHGLAGQQVFYKNTRGEYQIVKILGARAGHVKIENHSSTHSGPTWCFIATDDTDPPTGPGYLGSARTTTSSDWGITPHVSGDSGPISILDIGYTPEGQEYPSAVHDDNTHLSAVFEDLTRTPTDQSDTLVTDLGSLTALDLDHPDADDPIDSVTGVGTATAHELSGLGELKRRPSKSTLRKRLEDAETVEISEGDPDVAAKLKELQETRSTPPDSETHDESHELIAVDAILEQGPELYEISGQYRDQAMADIRNALDGVDTFDADAAFRLFTAVGDGLMYSPNGVKTGSLVQMHLGNVDMDATAFVGAPAGKGDSIDLTAHDTSLGDTPAVFLSRTSLADTVPVLHRAWKENPSTRLSELTVPAVNLVEQFTRDTTEDGKAVIPDPVTVTKVEPHLTEEKIGLAIDTPTDDTDSDAGAAESASEEWVSIPATFASFIAGLLGINLLEEAPENLELQVYRSGAIELKHPRHDLWVTLTT